MQFLITLAGIALLPAALALPALTDSSFGFDSGPKCEVKIINHHLQEGKKCAGDFVATGVGRWSLKNPAVECAEITVEC